MSRSLGRGRLRTRPLWTKAPHCKMSSGSLDGIVIQKPAQRLLALHLVGQGGLGGVIEVQRHDVADTLMWSDVDRRYGISRCYSGRDADGLGPGESIGRGSPESRVHAAQRKH